MKHEIGPRSEAQHKETVASNATGRDESSDSESKRQQQDPDAPRENGVPAKSREANVDNELKREDAMHDNDGEVLSSKRDERGSLQAEVSDQKGSEAGSAQIGSPSATNTNIPHKETKNDNAIAPNGQSEVLPVSSDPTTSPTATARHSRKISKTPSLTAAAGPSEFSHQQLAPQPEKGQGLDETEEDEEEQWQEMPAFAQYDLYDDDGRLVAKEAHDSDDENVYSNLGGAGKGYTRVQVDEDAQSATSMDDNTAYLFKETTNTLEEDDEVRDALAQMQATKDLLTDNQRIAYVGVVRLAMAEMQRTLEKFERTRGDRKQVNVSVEGMQMWSQKMMVRLFGHMELDPKG